MNFHKPNLKLNFKINLVGKIILGVIGIYVLYVLAIGLISSTCPEHYTAPDLGDNATDKDKAMIMADAVTHSLDTELDSVFGWIPDDLLSTSWSRPVPPDHSDDVPDYNAPASVRRA